MGWDLNHIRKSREKIINEQLADANRDVLLKRILELETILHPLLAPLSSIDENPGGSIFVESKLFPLLDEEDENFLVYDSKTSTSKHIGKTISTEDYAKHDYYLQDSIPLTDGTKLGDEFSIISVSQSVSVASIFCGNITMRDVRNAWKIYNYISSLDSLISPPVTEEKSGD